MLDRDVKVRFTTAFSDGHLAVVTALCYLCISVLYTELFLVLLSQEQAAQF